MFTSGSSGWEKGLSPRLCWQPPANMLAAWAQLPAPSSVDPTGPSWKTKEPTTLQEKTAPRPPPQGLARQTSMLIRRLRRQGGGAWAHGPPPAFLLPQNVLHPPPWPLTTAECDQKKLNRIRRGVLILALPFCVALESLSLALGYGTLPALAVTQDAQR